MKKKKYKKQIKHINVYKDRSIILKNLEFNNYNEYLKSNIWQEIREKMFYYYNEKCFICNNKFCLHIHHEKYTLENMSGKSLDGLFILCRGCHHRTEFKNNGEKRKSPRKIKTQGRKPVYL